MFAFRLRCMHRGPVFISQQRRCLSSKNAPMAQDINEWIQKSLDTRKPGDVEAVDFMNDEEDDDGFGILDDISYKSKTSQVFRRDSQNLTSSSLKEKEVFDEIFHSILSRGNARSHEGTRGPSKKTSTDQVQAVFTKGLNKDKEGSVSLSSADIRDTPLSVSSSLYKATENEHRKYTSATRALREYLKPTFDYMDKTCANNMELIKFLDQNIVAAYQKNGSIDNPLNEKHINETDLLQKIKTQSEKTPAHPFIIDLTLPMFINRIIHTLSFEFSCPSDALSVFNTIKKDLNLYANGCNGDTYNEMLLTVWTYNKDIYNIEMLIEEMNNNGITGNLRTFSILEKILKDCYRLFSGDSGQKLNQIFCIEDASRVRQIEIFLRKLNISLKNSLR